MADDGRRINKHCTGTVPKIKHRNNSGQRISERDSPRSLPNNLGSDWHHRSDTFNLVRNPGKNTRSNFYFMEEVEEHRRNGNGSILSSNGSVTPIHTSSSASRRNSVGSNVPKCDNITKYPDKRQIEDKLNQIREYLKITSSLMSSMKNSDEQVTEDEKEMLTKMMADLQDSEQKLVALLDEKSGDTSEVLENGANGIECSLKNSGDEHRSRDLESLRDQQLTFQVLQQKAENKLKEARQAQERYQIVSQSNNSLNARDKNLVEYDKAIQELEERAKGLNKPYRSKANSSEQYITEEIDALQDQIRVLHNANEDRNQLIQILDNRDAELRSQHFELQNKLQELQTKKNQVDQLVIQLQQNGEDSEEDDVGCQVRKIVLMKDQLAKLKDMLDIVQNTDLSVQNSTLEEQALASEVYAKAEKLLQKDIEKGNPSQIHSESSLPLRFDNMAGLVNGSRRKQVNRLQRDNDSSSNGAKPKISSISEKLALQAELKAKKRELEDIMGKHKASTSNLNHDVGIDTKSEFSVNGLFENVNGPWVPLIPSQVNRPESSNRYSSDEGPEDANDYSEVRSNQNHAFVLPLSVPSSNKPNKGIIENNHRVEYPHDYERLSSVHRTLERNIRSASVSTSVGEPSHNNTEFNKNQVHKQLELIRSMCDSILEQNNMQQPNVQQLRNNLTPSPIYTEPRQLASPNPHAMNALNVVNPPEPINNQLNNSLPDLTNYHNWVATNNLQTQAFMLNTLNQCCQMLWLQQRELATLRSAIVALQQERNERNVFDNVPPSLNPRTSNQNRPSNQKINQPAACSLPSLNQYNPPAVTVDSNFNNPNNIRLIDPCLNNVNHLNVSNNDHNSAVHGANANINSIPSQIWSGQALNNQVAPGNRANNYWDNFRSKSNEVLHNIGERSSNISERSNPFVVLSLSKCNSEQEATSTLHENIPQRTQIRPLRRYTNTNIAVVPPDVLNINQNSKNEDSSVPITNEVIEPRHSDENSTMNNNSTVYLNNATGYCESHSNVTTLEDRSRNEWHEEGASATASVNTKSKLFEELRENVYKEVASLISANEARPHFLIQLFRDLQLISSDPLRLKTLQSIQILLTQSLQEQENNNHQPADFEEILTDPNITLPISNFSMQSTVWSVKNPSVSADNPSTEESENVNQSDNTFHEMIPFLNDHETEIIHPHFIGVLKQVILDCFSFKEVVKDPVFQKHFSNILDEILTLYCGKSLQEVKMHLLQNIRELLQRELSFMNLIQGSCDGTINFINKPFFESHSGHKSESVDNNLTVPTQNEDLAEADQSHVEDNDLEEEGAVGGFLELSQEASVNAANAEMGNKTDTNLSASMMDFGAAAEPESQFQQGLDQVPTRLATKSKSRSNTPNRDCSSSKSEHDNDHF